MRNVGVRAAHEQEPQHVVAYMGFFMLALGFGAFGLSLVMWASFGS